jgi:hypothetical protein
MTHRDRVHLLGRRNDVPALLRLANVFVDSHPIGGMTACLEAMQAGLPALVLSEGRDPLFSGEEALGLTECIAQTREDFVARLGRLTRDAGWRQTLGRRLHDRYAQHYDPAVVAARYAAFLRALPAQQAAHPLPQSLASGQRLLHPIQLGNANERRAVDYVLDALALARGGPTLAFRMARQFPAVCTLPRFYTQLRWHRRPKPTCDHISNPRRQVTHNETHKARWLE